MSTDFANVFRYGGSCGALASAKDWAKTPLGLPSQWPAALQHSFKLCLELPAVTCVLWGRDCHLLYGDAFLNVFAEKHPWSFGRKASEVWEESWGTLRPQLNAVFETGKPCSSPSQLFKFNQDGLIQERHLAYTFTPIRDDDGRICGILNIAHDKTLELMAIRARSEAQEALDRQTMLSAQTRSLLQLLTDGTPDVIYVKDHNCRLVHVNSTMCRMFDRPQSDIVGLTDADLLPVQQAHAVRQNDQLVMRTRQTHTFEEEMSIVGDTSESGLSDWIVTQGTPDGELPSSIGSSPHRWMVTRLYLATKSPWIAPDGTLLGMFCIGRDITERKAQEDLLRQINETLEEMVAQRTLERDRIWRVSREVFVVAGTNGRYTSVNPAFARVLGWSFDEAINMRPLALVHPADKSTGTALFAKVLKGETVSGYRCRMRHRDGSYRWLNWTMVPEGDLVYAVARDVTDEQIQSETLARAEEQLRQAQKMEAVGQLTGGIAHDFNNLLATIMSSLELLQRRAEAGHLGEMNRYVTAARTSAQRAASLTQRLLAFSRRQALDPRPLDVNALINDMQELMRSTLGEDIVLDMRLQPNLPPAFTDLNQLESAVLNLAINARDAMDKGGTLCIITQLEHLGPSDSDGLADLQPGDYVTVCVSDTGMGMPPEVIAKAFDPFFTTKPIGQGTGLGLSMIYGYVKQSGGHVAIDSTPGQGTCVKLYLPRWLAEKAKVDGGDHDDTLSDGDPPPTPLGAGESILVVEDEAGVRMVVLEVLRELGYVAHEAIDATSALRLVDAGVRIDLLVTDVGLPGTNGRQLAEMVRARRHGLKVLFITGYTGHAAIRAEFLDAGMDMLAKPFLIDDLAQKIESMLKLPA